MKSTLSPKDEPGETQNKEEDLFDSGVETQLKGTTLTVYWYLLREKETGVRELQRALDLSSPSVASYHLEKLLDLGVAGKRNGQFFLHRKVNLGVLSQFVMVGDFILPRYLFYAVFMTIFFVGYFFFFYLPSGVLTTSSLFALLFGTISNSILWLETIRSWKARPF